ncbi:MULTISPECIES: hypothetical protein [unclassified Cryobacterium]|uniref:hypothetical protein n=1 Tax=unclassified Cryobacterium TaxID=2649013 RepID=UPI002AB4F457|nr:MULTISPECIES: hypothetical protein [unclassified Cryobacterium]MDY7542609.1 hypothetical protein [Cryobacterium sp. 5B3]MEB0264729.1 hypothetical protein [Cryobacterium sp. 10I5]MEB0273701.1 hypothetical protein [Cryobacterium sp. 5B3]
MAVAYQSLEPGEQIIISDEPREDLEALARWVSIPVPEPTAETPTVIPDGEPTEKWAVGELKAFAAREEIDLGAAKNKGEYFAAIIAGLAEKAVADAATASGVALDPGAEPAGNGTPAA